MTHHLCCSCKPGSCKLSIKHHLMYNHLSQKHIPVLWLLTGRVILRAFWKIAPQVIILNLAWIKFSISLLDWHQCFSSTLVKQCLSLMTIPWYTHSLKMPRVLLFITLEMWDSRPIGASDVTDKSGIHLPGGCWYCWWCFVAKPCLILLQFHGLQPTRLLCPWDYLRENTGMDSHFLL